MKRTLQTSMKEQLNIFRLTPKLLLAILLMMVLPKTFADSVILRDSVQVSGARVALKDLAHLEGNEARKLADVTIYTWKANEDFTTISIQQVRKELSKRSVNWALLMVKGSNKTRVIREGDHAKSVETNKNPASETTTSNQPKSVRVTIRPGALSPVVVKKDQASQLEHEIIEKSDIRNDELVEQNSLHVMATPREADQRQIRHVVIDWLRRHLDTDYKSLQVTFRDRDAEWLNQKSAGYQYEITTSSTDLLGRRTFTIMRYRNRIFVDSRRVMITVKQKVMGYVLTQTVGRDELLRRRDVVLKSIWIDSMKDANTVSDMKAVLGMVAARDMKAGEILSERKIAKPMLIKRGQTVKVSVIRGNISVQIFARAEQSGAYGDYITVRSQSTKKKFTVKVVGSHLAVSEG